MARQAQIPADISQTSSEGSWPKKLLVNTRFINLSSIIFAILQSACTAVIAVSGVRVAIGFSALAAAAGIHTPAHGFHQDAIRIPMMVLAFLGAFLNLFIIWRVRGLRGKPAAVAGLPTTEETVVAEGPKVVHCLMRLVDAVVTAIADPGGLRQHGRRLPRQTSDVSPRSHFTEQLACRQRDEAEA